MSSADPARRNRPFFIGCPVWASELWKGTLFTRRLSRNQMLEQYSRVFNTVEGNSVFYGLPTDDALKRWIEHTSEGFRFALKFPRVISHDKELAGAAEETKEFLRVLETLAKGDRLGPSFLQLSPHFSPLQFKALKQYLRNLPREFSYALEVRHADFFDQGENEKRLADLLVENGVSNVMLDSRPLFAKAPADESETISQRRKPRTPVRSQAIGEQPTLRLIGRNDVASLELWSQSWAKIIARWVGQGAAPYVFTHTPDEAFAPAFGRLLYSKLQAELNSLPPMPDFFGEAEAANEQSQQRLF